MPLFAETSNRWRETRCWIVNAVTEQIKTEAINGTREVSRGVIPPKCSKTKRIIYRTAPETKKPTKANATE